jgi:hypothetical protein
MEVYRSLRRVRSTCSTGWLGNWIAGGAYTFRQLFGSTARRTALTKDFFLYLSLFLKVSAGNAVDFVSVESFVCVFYCLP